MTRRGWVVSGFVCGFGFGVGIVGLAGSDSLLVAMSALSVAVSWAVFVLLVWGRQ